MRWLLALAGSLMLHLLLIVGLGRIERGQGHEWMPEGGVLQAHLLSSVQRRGQDGERSTGEVASGLSFVVPSANAGSDRASVLRDGPEVSDDRSANLLPVVRPVPLTEFESPDFTQWPNLDPGARLVLTVQIDQAGQVVGIERASSTFPAGVDDLLMKAFGQMRFRPGLYNGQPIKSSLTVEIRSEDLRLPLVQ